jgi:excisionase family DNA binding protein
MDRDRHKKITAAPEKIALQMSEAAYVSGLSRGTLYTLINDGKLPSLKAAGRRLILCADLEKYLVSLRSASSAADAREALKEQRERISSSTSEPNEALKEQADAGADLHET